MTTTTVTKTRIARRAYGHGAAAQGFFLVLAAANVVDFLVGSHRSPMERSYELKWTVATVVLGVAAVASAIYMRQPRAVAGRAVGFAVMALLLHIVSVVHYPTLYRMHQPGIAIELALVAISVAVGVAVGQWLEARWAETPPGRS
jgi:hypothetical protein